MKLRFAPGADGAIWPPLTGSASAAFGEITLGPDGLRRLLEGEVGLLAPEEPERVRAARLIPELQRTPGFWSASLEVDPFGVARTLLGWLDELVLEGWDGSTGGDRLVALDPLRQLVADGGPARLAPLASAIAARGTDLEQLTLLEPRSEMPLLWRQVLDALEARGTDVVEQLPGRADSSGDLAAALNPDFAPKGDGSLQLVRASGPLAAADDLAAWLASQPAGPPTLIVGADVVLDQALRRHGLPTSGASEPSDNSLLQVLPLVLQLAVAPADPQRALELLTLPSGPVPGVVAGRLVDALHETPAVGGELWSSALLRGLDRIDDPDRRARVQERVEALFSQPLAADLFPSSVVAERTERVADWLRGRLRVADSADEDTSRWAAALGQCRALAEMLAASALAELTSPMLQRLLRDAADAAPGVARLPAAAGLHFTGGPDGVLGVCDTIIWWGFGRTSAPSPRRSPFRAAERRLLAAAGVDLPAAGELALRFAERWARPLRLATSRLLLICPEVDVDGEAVDPHPLWDEICARVGPGQAPAPLTSAGLGAGLREVVKARDLPEAQHLWTVSPAAVTKRDLESPSSLEKFLGCPLRWVLDYGGKVRAGRSARLTADERLVGSLVHEVVAQVLSEAPWSDQDAAGTRAQELFDRLGPATAALLFQPEAARLRATARLATRSSVISLLAHLADAGLEPTRVEQTREASTFAGRLAGTADLVTGPDAVVVDLKWGGLGYRRGSLEKGSALQLAAYAALESAATGGVKPEGAYFILRNQRLLTTSDRFPGAERVRGVSPQETWLGTERAWKAAWQEAAQGDLRARGVPDEANGGAVAPDKSHLDAEGVLQSQAGCGFCEYGALCGLGVGE